MMIKIIVSIIGVALIGFISWWFFGNHVSREVNANVKDNMQKVTIEVNGGYSPSTVVLKKDVPAQLNFYRKDPSSCLEQVVFSDFGINRKLKQNANNEITIDTSKTGEYYFTCGMNMFKGKVVIK